MFESTVDDPSISCRMIPAPSLFAEPSSPRARYGLSVMKTPKLIASEARSTRTWVFQR